MGIEAVRILRRAAAALVLLGISAGFCAAEVHLGLRLGRRTIFDDKIVEVYGEGFLYSPFLRLTSERTLLGIEIVDETDITLDMQAMARRQWAVRSRSLQILSDVDPKPPEPS